MDKFQQEIINFSKNFDFAKNKKIVLYGTGRMTATVCTNLEGYNILGLCDRYEEMVGSRVFGYKVLSRKEVEDMADLIIINTAPTYWNAIYERISDWDIDIYYANGKKACNVEKRVFDDGYYTLSVDDLKKEIENSDIISFDIFDTVICRYVSDDNELFHLIDKLVKEKYPHIDYYEIRKRASDACGEYASYNCIYEKAVELGEWTEEEASNIKDLEYMTDFANIYGREQIIDIYNYYNDKKKIYFISDMYYTAEMLQQFLNKVGISTNKENIIVSCEIRKRKKNGSLWKYWSEVNNGKKCLHIGDNPESDIVPAEKYGINAFLIKSPIKMFEESLIGRVLSDADSDYTKWIVSKLKHDYFSDPFAMRNKNGQVKFRDFEDLGFWLLGPLVYLWVAFINEKAHKLGADKVFFMMREGYLMCPEYEQYRRFNKDDEIEGFPLNISRKLVMNIYAQDKKSILEIAKFPFKGNFKEYMRQRFSVIVDDASDIDVGEIQKNEDILWSKLEPYENLIIGKAKKLERNFKRYIETIGLSEKSVVVDSFRFGNIQRYLGCILKKRMNGIYMIIEKENNICYEQQNMYSVFQEDDDIHGTNNEINQYSIFLESFFTAPHGMLVDILDDGTCVWGESMKNQECFVVREEMQEGIFRFISEVKQNNITISKNDRRFTKKLFGLLMNNGFIKENEFVNAFWYDNGLIGNSQTKIF